MDKLKFAGVVDCPQISSSYKVWHKRLGHAPLNKLKHRSDIQLKVEENKVCIACPMAKFTTQPFQPSSNRNNSVCEMIHMDIRGLNRVPTDRNYKYFLTLVDDCTRTTCVYLLEQKSQALSTIQLFMKLVSTQFQATVKMVRSDNVFEFHSDPC